MITASRYWHICCLILLAVVIYLPALHLPFISDDYVQIPLALHYSAEGWRPFLHDSNLRTRATYMFLNSGLAGWFGFNPMPFYTASILLHATCVLCVYATRVWLKVTEFAAFSAACFFAVFEGHNEAVLWIAASSDLLVVLFAMICWLLWVKWLQGGSALCYLGSLAALLAAAASKESFWVLPALMLLPALVDLKLLRRALAGLAPFALIAAGYVVWSYFDRVSTAGYSDIRFSLSAAWPVVILFSCWRMLFIWGLIALSILAIFRRLGETKLIAVWLCWIVIGVFPYSFLSYMRWVPSRHTYLASVGVAMLTGMAAQRLLELNKLSALRILAAMALLINIEIIWVKKMSQFRERAEPSELLKEAAQRSAGPIQIDCIPLSKPIVAAIVQRSGKEAVYNRSSAIAAEHCFAISYRDAAGKTVTVAKQMDRLKHGAFH